MKATTAIGIVVAFVGLAVGATMEGSQIPAFFNVPALVIIMKRHDRLRDGSPTASRG